jgi:hypothetical protein
MIELFVVATIVNAPLTMLRNDRPKSKLIVLVAGALRSLVRSELMENRHGPQGRAQAARTHHRRQLRDYQH